MTAGPLPSPSVLRPQPSVLSPVFLRTVLFDLDGTFADTAPELAATLNYVREEQGHAPLPFGLIRSMVSHGTRGLIRLGFGLSPDDPGYAPVRSRLLEVYSRDLGCQTALFPEIPELLESLEGLGLNWGIVTNKPGWLTDPLMRRLGIGGRACCIVSGDTVEYSKPHPAPLWHACRLAGSAPHECLYVGDAERDVQAGRQAGMKTVVALYGYLGSGDNPGAWNADGFITRPLEVLGWVPQRQGLTGDPG